MNNENKTDDIYDYLEIAKAINSQIVKMRWILSFVLLAAILGTILDPYLKLYWSNVFYDIIFSFTIGIYLVLIVIMICIMQSTERQLLLLIKPFEKKETLYLPFSMNDATAQRRALLLLGDAGYKVSSCWLINTSQFQQDIH